MTTDDSGRSRTFNVVVNGSPLIITVMSTVEGSDVQLSSTGNKSFRIDVEGQSYRVEVASGTTPTTIPSLPKTSDLVAPAPVTPAPSVTPVTPSIVDGETVMAAPIPGTIVRYTVAEAQLIKAGETVVVLEAMKMENTLAAPVDGVIKSIRSQAGARVARGDILLVIGPA